MKSIICLVIGLSLVSCTVSYTPGKEGQKGTWTGSVQPTARDYKAIKELAQ